MPKSLVLLLILAILPRSAWAEAESKRPPRFSVRDESAPKVLLQGEDVLALQDEEAELAARLERRTGPGILSPLPEQTVHFFAGDQCLGSARTNQTGRVVLRHHADKTGDFFIKLSLSRQAKDSGSPYAVLFRVRPADTRFVLVDIEKTLHDLSGVRFPFVPNSEIPPMEGCVEVLKRLAEQRSIIYLCSGDGSDGWKIREWLAGHEFPVGPVLFLNLPREDAAAAAAKSEAMKKLKDRFPNLLCGIGNRRSDALAFHENQMISYLIRPAEEGPLPAGAHVCATWRDLQERLFPN